MSFLSALPGIGTAIDAVGNVAGSIMQNASNAKQAQLNRDFQERMSSTAYQRGVADLRKAGLNPALAYGQANASSPTGSTAHMENTLGNASNSAGELATRINQNKLIQSQANATNATAENQSAQANLTRTTTAATLAEILSRTSNLDVNSALAGDKRFTERAHAGLLNTSRERMESLTPLERANLELDAKGKEQEQSLFGVRARLKDEELIGARMENSLSYQTLATKVAQALATLKLTETNSAATAASTDTSRLENTKRGLEMQGTLNMNRYNRSVMGRSAPYVHSAAETAKLFKGWLPWSK